MAGRRLRTQRVMGAMSDGMGGRPQPESQPMSKATADWYVVQTGGQLQGFLHEDGNWHLYAPAPIAVQPKILTDQMKQDR